MTPAYQSSLTGARKAAIFLMGVGDPISSDVLRCLAPDEVQRITAEIAATPSVVSDEVMTVFREFEVRTAEGRFFAKGGADCAKRIVERAFGSESGQKLLNGAAPEASPRSLLEQTDPQQLAAFLRSEHPQTIAVLLCSIAPKTAASLLASLPVETQGQVVIRMANVDRVSPEAFQKVAGAIGEKVKSRRRMEKPDGVRALASLLNHVPTGHADALLGCVEEQSQTLAADVRNRMFVFEDVLSIGNEGMKAIIARVDRKLLTVALKGVSAKVRAHFTAQMSQRAAEMLAEDMEAMGPVRVSDVKAAQSEVILVVRKLQQEGAVSAGGAADEYVE
jgi:flagellar motor switch protein FliG